MSLPFIHWFGIMRKQYHTKSDSATAQRQNGLMRCCVCFPCRGLNSPASKSFQWSALSSLLENRRKIGLLKISSDLRPNLISRPKWLSSQICSRAGVCWSGVYHSSMCLSIPGGLLALWAVRDTWLSFPKAVNKQGMISCSWASIDYILVF